jgi:hypothetical protein
VGVSILELLRSTLQSMIFYNSLKDVRLLVPKRFFNRPEYALSGSHSTLSFLSTDRSEK